jgi:hypothetical protein
MEIGKKITSETEVAVIQAASPASNSASAEVLGDYLLEPASKNPLSRGQRGDRLIRINLSRNTLIAIIFSLLIHGLILLTVVPQINFDNAAAPQPQAIEVSLAPPKSAQVIEPKPQEKQQEAPKVKPPKTIRPSPKVIAQKPNRNVKPSFTVPEVLTTPKPSPEVAPPKDSAPTDMASYVKARQAQRQATEADAAKQNAEAVAREVGPSESKIRDERIKNNFKNGTNGIFEITSLNSRRAAFAFRGWTNDYSNARRESFEVEASTGQDVRLLMIRKMITLIRQHYQGDFNWDSHRLGRVEVKSARPEDSANLEDFMMMEFFGANYKTAQ